MALLMNMSLNSFGGQMITMSKTFTMIEKIQNRKYNGNI